MILDKNYECKNVSLTDIWCLFCAVRYEKRKGSDETWNNKHLLAIFVGKQRMCISYILHKQTKSVISHVKMIFRKGYGFPKCPKHVQ